MKNAYEKELNSGYTGITVMAEAERCLLCHEAPCSASCPAGTDPARFIRSIRFRNFKGAAETIRSNNALGAVCARVCPTERYCEEACSRCGIDKPIDIGGLQRFATDFESKTGMKILEKGEANGKKIAVIGSGPSGLQAAASLLQKGYAVDIYEKDGKAGGFLRYALPKYRLPEEVVDGEVNRIAELGANFIFCREVGSDVKMDELKVSYDVVLVACGVETPVVPELFKGCSHAVHALDFLREVRQGNGAAEVPGSALVIGGGDTAMDAATTLKLMGVPTVINVTRKQLSDFRASKAELETARKAGVTIIDGYSPTAVDGKKVSFKHRSIDSELTIEADMIVLATGQKLEPEGLGLDADKNEAVCTDYCAGGNVFVTGDIAPGEKTVVYAVRKGKEAADAIDSFLGGK